MVSRTQPSHDRGHHRNGHDLKTEFIFRRKIRYLSVSLFLHQLRGFSLPQIYRIVACIGSHTGRLFRNRRAATTPFYTCATALSRRFFSLSPSAFRFLAPMRERGARNRYGRRGRRSQERITRSGVVYSRLSKVKATRNLAHTNQSTLAPWRRRSRERHPIHLCEITLYQPWMSSTSSSSRWRAGHREKTDRRRAALLLAEARMPIPRVPFRS